MAGNTETGEGGFALPNDFVLDLNRSLTVPQDMDLPAPWNLPSRLFQFPIEVSEADANGKRRFGLMHPLLGDHPFARLVAAQLGVELDPHGAPNDCGVSDQGKAMWWHAVDLISSGHWRELLDTRQFTTPADIMGAVAYGLDYSPHDRAEQRGHITVADAREVMAAIGGADPGDRLQVLRRLSPPSPYKDDKGHDRCPVNSGGCDPATAAWARIFGIEGGWLRHDAGGFLQWTVLGRDMYGADDELTFTEAATGQGAFAF